MQKKIGIDPNPLARNYCKLELKIDCFESLSSIESKSIDIIISNYFFEHCERPFDIIKDLYSKLKKGGMIIIVVLLDTHRYKFIKEDVNKHLYSFSPMNIWNHLLLNNFVDIKTRIINHRWPSFYVEIQKLFGWNIFHFLSKIYAHIIPRSQQTIAIGKK